jgi:adenosylcobinamide-phosphate synthase
MNYLIYLQPLTSILSAILLAILVDIALRLLPQARDRLMPLLGLPAGLALSLNRRLNRQERATNTRYNRGIFTFAVIVLFGFMLGFFCVFLVRQLLELEPVIWFLCFQVTFPWTAGAELLKALQEPEKQAVSEGLAILRRRQVSVLVPTANPDRHAIARMMIEATATSLHRGWLSPVLWAIVVKLFGGPALVTAIIVVTLLEAERVLVTQDTKNTPFVLPFELAEAIINFIPARVAALLWALGAFFTPGAKPLTSLRAMFVQSSAHRAVNSGWPVGAVAGALNIALPGGRKRDLWVGAANSTAKAEPRDIRRAMFLHAVTLGLTILIFTALLLLSIGA